MKGKKVLLALLLGLCACLATFATGCLKGADDTKDTGSEWSDNNVDDDGWI